MVKARLSEMKPDLIVRLWRHTIQHLYGYLVFKPLWAEVETFQSPAEASPLQKRLNADTALDRHANNNTKNSIDLYCVNS